ncbi:DUF1835 domain-containing protein [Anaerocolumna sp. MB42-C2]|uniref:DUF1835 domain-containing protein n=1 Tax=Anaerocolumna sp. MB42-C2 TaxID=3070997 RepID=UPI0027E1CB25|nr:DUF1835 domain-containing protein [Anaerocolumna sp. MB42-C2]WMJ89191.1 DUF1835 domain-containing protein [Anaerocolumna sp. MB42-C2]
MIEILFGDSEAGSMKASKSSNTIKIGEKNGSTSCSDEVICLAFMLDIGDIKKSIESQYRQDLILSMFTQNGWDNNQEVLKELKMAIKIYIKEFSRLLEFLKKGESIRIWYSDSPYSLCGLYYLCHILRNYSNDTFVVKLPEYVQTDINTIKKYCNWGEVSAEEFSQFLVYEKKITLSEIRMFGNQWVELVENNSPLRAVINGNLIGVPEDFYDFLIRRRLSSNPAKEARVIGDILGYYPLGIGDWWYASRIEHMIKAGSIRVVEDSERKYARTICMS